MYLAKDASVDLRNTFNLKWLHAFVLVKAMADRPGWPQNEDNDMPVTLPSMNLSIQNIASISHAIILMANNLSSCKFLFLS